MIIGREQSAHVQNSNGCITNNKDGHSCGLPPVDRLNRIMPPAKIGSVVVKPDQWSGLLVQLAGGFAEGGRLAAISLWILIVLTGCHERLPGDMQKSLDSTISFVEEFRRSHSHLPSRDDFLAWHHRRGLVGVCDYGRVFDPAGDCYRIYIWRGERMLMYSSKDQGFHDPNYERTE
jgi:hypothetical protein